jgi:hypothetical protein
MEPQKYTCGNLGWYPKKCTRENLGWYPKKCTRENLGWYPKKCTRGILGWYSKKCTRENLCWYPIENLGWYPIIYICGNLGETGPKAQRWTFWLIWRGQHRCGQFGSRTLDGVRAVGFSGDTPVHGRSKRFRGHGPAVFSDVIKIHWTNWHGSICSYFGLELQLDKLAWKYMFIFFGWTMKMDKLAWRYMFYSTV